MVSQVTCYYHPEVVATDKCDRCRRPICLNDVMKYEKRYRTGSGTSHHHHHSYSVIYTYCPLCYADVVEKEYSIAANIFKLGVAVFAFFFILIFFNIFGTFFSGFGGVFPFMFFFPVIFMLVPIIIILIIVYDVAVVGPRKLKVAQQTRANFLRSLNRSSSIAVEKEPLTINQQSISNLVCFECGAPLEPTDKFCPNCGDPTDEERQTLKNTS